MTPAEYVERAEECERLARAVISPAQRQKILRIAAGWRELADEAEARLAGTPRAA